MSWRRRATMSRPFCHVSIDRPMPQAMTTGSQPPWNSFATLAVKKIPSNR